MENSPEVEPCGESALQPDLSRSLIEGISHNDSTIIDWKALRGVIRYLPQFTRI